MKRETKLCWFLAGFDTYLPYVMLKKRIVTLLLAAENDAYQVLSV